MGETLFPVAPAREPPAGLPGVSAAALLPIIFEGRTRLLCQECGWTVSQPHVGNLRHNGGHFRAEAVTARLRDGFVPVHGVTGRWVAKLCASRVVRDDAGEDSRQRLQWRAPLGEAGPGFPRFLWWIRAEDLEDFAGDLGDLRAPATRRWAREVMLFAGLVARGIPSWIAAAGWAWARAGWRSGHPDLALEIQPWDPNVAAWLRGEWKIELVDEIRERVEAVARELNHRGVMQVSP